MKDEEVYIMMETWDGHPVRVPEGKLEDWKRGQEEQKRLAEEGKKIPVPEAFMQKMLELMEG